MKKIIIDTNALISFVTDRNVRQQDRIAELFDIAARLKLLILCHQNVITEFVYVMDKIYQVPANSINSMVMDLINMPGIEIVHAIKMKTLLSYWPEHFYDYGDAVIASLCKNIKGSSVATFDRKFGNRLKKVGLKDHSF